MARIKQLSAHEAQKIAAGEVVERPANVVKELLENALDAHATSITISIEEAGKTVIRVVDNGCGMSAQDAQLCFAHHATSKISSIDDLPYLNTFGFRGEALSSIAAVSKVSLITKEAEASQGTQVIIEGSTVQHVTAVPANTGTDITIADLFFNVPARKKFLKTRETELRHIILLFQAACLDYLNIHFKLFSENALLFNCPPVTSLEQRVAQLWDHLIAAQMIPLEAKDTQRELQVQGIISHHTYFRYDRSSLFFFVNRRWVKNPGLCKALLKGYLNVLPPDRFPAGALFITINPATIDVNIHPRKEEIQFLNPKVIETLITEGVKKALETSLGNSLPLQSNTAIIKPSFHSAQRIGSDQTVYQSNEGHLPALRYVNNYTPTPTKNLVKPTPPSSFSLEQQLPLEQKAPVLLQPESYTIIGQFKKTYLLIEQEDALFIVDQHAAHERILYELFSKRFEEVASIKLMFPQVITLSSAELLLLEPHFQLFKDHSIEIEAFGENQIIINSIPTHFKEIPLEPLIRQCIGWITEFQQVEPSLFYKELNEKLHAQMACKAAVKAGDILTETQMHQLLEDLANIDNRFTCPHGRPTGWSIPLYDIEKKFKRKL